MRVAVLQPSYLPWLGYLEQVARVDAFVFYDDVQYDKNGWRNRNRIRTASAEGWSWLTVPAILPAAFASISDVRVDPRMPWRRKHLAALRHAYARAPHGAELDRWFEPLFGVEHDRLADVAIASVRCLAAAFGIETALYRSSELDVGGDRNGRLIAICRRLGADTYLSGAAAKVYLDEAAFAAAGIAVEWQAFEHPVYAQPHRPFISHLSAIDALLCAGRERAATFVGVHTALTPAAAGAER